MTPNLKTSGVLTTDDVDKFFSDSVAKSWEEAILTIVLSEPTEITLE